MMLRIAAGDASPGDSLEGSRRSSASQFSPLNLWSFSYRKLPEDPIRLSILKLDGSSFDVNVMSSATVGDLMQAIEDLFSHEPANISWSHVWGHFCLFFHGQKLLTQTDSISSYGIKDGDQLEFIRHISSNSNVTKVPSSKSKRQKPWSLQGPNSQAADSIEYSWGDLEKASFQNYRKDPEASEDERGRWRYSPSPENAGDQYDGGGEDSDDAPGVDVDSPTDGCGLALGLSEILGFRSGKGYHSLRDTRREE